MPDWGAIFKNRANYCGIKMQTIAFGKIFPTVFFGFFDGKKSVRRTILSSYGNITNLPIV